MDKAEILDYCLMLVKDMTRKYQALDFQADALEIKLALLDLQEILNEENQSGENN